MPVLEGAALIEHRVQALRGLHDRVGTPRAQLDLSGGIDSAVMLGLLARALGAENLTVVHSRIHSGSEFLDRARLCAEVFGVRLVEIELSDLFDRLVDEMRKSLVDCGVDSESLTRSIEADPTILGSLRSCLRAPIGRGFNRMTVGGIRHGTGNECEDRFLRFYQKGGDGEVDTNPIAMLSKGEVLQLARFLGVPRELIEAVPSPDLHGVGERHNDEDELRALCGVEWTYSRIDPEGGEYTRVGTIERMNRFLDAGHAEGLFREREPDRAQMLSLVEQAERFFPGRSSPDIEGLIRSCRHQEAVTRHKACPQIPTLGRRGDLVALGILTDELPELG